MSGCGVLALSKTLRVHSTIERSCGVKFRSKIIRQIRPRLQSWSLKSVFGQRKRSMRRTIDDQTKVCPIQGLWNVIAIIPGNKTLLWREVCRGGAG